ncbi:MAG: DnaJ domain-containing protein [Desulfobacterales bacterium]|nr:DnaJ domain-containing protein [Desulfobacterales bacterium]
MEFLKKRAQARRDAVRVRRFLKVAAGAADTPVLIRQVAAERFYMKCCAAAAGGRHTAPESVRLRRQMKEEARRLKISFSRIEERLAPVAAGLGLGPAVSGGEGRVDYYEVMGVGPDTDGEALKKAYRNLARRLHPDAPTGEKEPFLALQEAYEVLSDPVLRGWYDAGRKGAGRIGWSEGGAAQEREAAERRSALRRQGLILAAVILLLACISLLADHLLR